ncbi:MAG: BACON domain-containing protein [Bacteroidales bacterium]|nr:BACON domain-containing protein [Bacteroidales bacterium]
MKRFQTRILYLLILFAFLPSCRKEPELTLTGPSSIELSVDGKSKTITFTTNRDWTATCSDSWIHVSPSSGSASDGQISVSIRCDANTTYDSRSGTVTISAESLIQNIRVTQAQKDGLVVKDTSFEIKGDGGPLSINLESNVALEVVPQVDWIHYGGYSDTKGLVPGTITLNVDANGPDAIREGTVIVRCNQLESTVKIRQYAKAGIFSIPEANLEVNDDRVSTEVRIVNEQTGRDNLRETGVYKAWAMIREMVANGTRTKDANAIKTLLRRNRPIIGNEQPMSNYKDLEWCEFPVPPPPGCIYEWEDPNEGYSHGQSCAANMLAVLYPVLDVLNLKIGFSGDFKLKDRDVFDETEDGNFYQLYKYFEKNKGLILYYSSSRAGLCSNDNGNVNYSDSYSALRLILALPNTACFMNCFMNVSNNLPDYRFKQKIEDAAQWDDIWTNVKYYNVWSFGADGVMGGDNNGISHCWNGEGRPNGISYMPVASRRDDDRIWCDTSHVLGDPGSPEPTSYSTPVATAKYFLASLLNQCYRPDISQQENRKLIRNTCLDQTVYQGDEVYMIGKRINPGGLVPQFFSQLPERATLSSEKLIPLTTSVFKGSIIVGPGVVDAEGTPVTEENYRSMWGKTLYLSPSLLRNCGYKVGEVIELVEYLCLDEKAAGTGVLDDAFHYIDRQTTTVALD